MKRQCDWPSCIQLATAKVEADRREGGQFFWWACDSHVQPLAQQLADRADTLGLGWARWLGNPTHSDLVAPREAMP